LHYLYFIKVRVLVSMAYRFEAISTVFIQFIILAVNVFFWKAVYGNAEAVAGTTLKQMLIYSVISLVMTCFFCKSVEQRLRQQVREGNVAVDIIKPIDMFLMHFSNDVGNIIVNLSQKALPMILFACIFITPPIPASAAHFALFCISSVFSFLILWLIAAIFGMLNFWITDIGPIGDVKDLIITFLSGSIVPVWFFPPVIGNILAFTPFIYTYQTPISIFIGKLTVYDGLFQILIQGIWCLLFYLLFSIMKKRALNNLMVQGG